MPDRLRAAERVSVVSTVWTLASSAVAIALGLSSRSLVLIAFGAVGLMDALGSYTLVLHFRHALHHEAISERREQIAHRVVSAGLVVTGLATAVESVRRLINHTEGHGSGPGAALAAVSAVVLAVLARRKRRIASAVGSRALHADGWLSATGALLAAVTVAGTLLAGSSGAWWIDPAGALLIGASAAAVGVYFWRQNPGSG